MWRRRWFAFLDASTKLLDRSALSGLEAFAMSRPVACQWYVVSNNDLNVPAVNARSPAPESRTTLTSGRWVKKSKTSFNSYHMGSKKALSFSGLLISTCATYSDGKVRLKCLSFGESEGDIVVWFCKSVLIELLSADNVVKI